MNKEINSYDMNETYVEIDTEDEEARTIITNYLSAFVEGYQFMPSFRAGVFDGKKKYYSYNENGNIIAYKGLIYHLIRELKKSNIKLNYENSSTLLSVTKEELTKFIESLNLGFEPYDYQFQTVFDFINKGRLTAQLATGAGKSLIAFIISAFFASKDMKVMIIVPNISLTNQIASDFIKDYKYDKPENVHTISGGKEKHLDCPITITTWQSGVKFTHLMEQVDVVIIDEAHLAKSSTYDETIIPSITNCTYRLGLSGTISDLSYADRLTLVGTLGPNHRYINAQGLIDRGLATPTFISCLFLNYSDEDKKLAKGLKYQPEISFIEGHEKRNKLVTKMTNKIAKSGNTILLFNTIKHGVYLMELLLKDKFGIDNLVLLDKITPKKLEKFLSYEVLPEKIFTNTKMTDKHKKTIEKFIKTNGLDDSFLDSFDALENYDIYMIYGAIEGTERERIRLLLSEKKDAIIVGNYAVMSTGINIKTLRHIIFGISTKSSIRVRQTIGRGLRLHGEKTSTHIWDIVDDFSTTTKTGKTRNKNYCLKHFETRILTYHEDGFPVTEKEISVN